MTITQQISHKVTHPAGRCSEGPVHLTPTFGHERGDCVAGLLSHLQLQLEHNWRAMGFLAQKLIALICPKFIFESSYPPVQSSIGMRITFEMDFCGKKTRKVQLPPSCPPKSIPY